MVRVVWGAESRGTAWADACVAAATRLKRSKGRIVVLEMWVSEEYGQLYNRVSEWNTLNVPLRRRDYSAGAGARKIRSLIFENIRSYMRFPFSASASDGRPIEPALPLGTVSQPRR